MEMCLHILRIVHLPRYRNGSNREFLHFYRILTCFTRYSAKYFAGCLGGYVRSLLDDNLCASYMSALH